MLERIIEKVNKCSNEVGKLYLLELLTGTSGFFLLDKKILLLSKNITEKKSESIETEKLILNTKVNIATATDMPTFEEGEYNYVLYRGEINDTDFENFIQICMIYTKSKNKLSLKDFFYSIIDMFQLPGEQTYKNLIGLYGELEIMLNAYKKCNWDLSSGWHSGSLDKYDFVENDIFIEIKTTMSDILNVQLKHSQIFERKGVYLGIVHLEESNGGQTLSDLINEINSIPIFKNNFNFQVSLGRELNRVSSREIKNKRFNVKQIMYIKNSNIPTLHNIPENITEIVYKCVLIGIDTEKIEDIYIKAKGITER